jgi:hypothetical protein
MIICNHCGSPCLNGVRACPECGAETPLISGPGSQTLPLRAGPDFNAGELAAQPSPQFLPPPRFSDAAGSPSFQPRPAAHAVPADSQSRPSRTPLVVAVSVLATVCVMAVGFIAVRAWLTKDQAAGRRRVEIVTPAAAAPMPSATATQAAGSQPAASSPSAVNTTADARAIEQEVTAALNGWAAASEAHDLDAHMSYYADTLDTYYRLSNVSSARVRADRARAYDTYSRLNVRLSRVEVTPYASGARAEAVFDKTFEFESDSKRLTGSVRQEVWLSKINGRWLITGEKDLQVYYLNH